MFGGRTLFNCKGSHVIHKNQCPSRSLTEEDVALPHAPRVRRSRSLSPIILDDEGDDDDLSSFDSSRSLSPLILDGEGDDDDLSSFDDDPPLFWTAEELSWFDKYRDDEDEESTKEEEETGIRLETTEDDEHRIGRYLHGTGRHDSVRHSSPPHNHHSPSWSLSRDVPFPPSSPSSPSPGRYDSKFETKEDRMS